MTAQQILNADMTTIGRWIRQGLAWWGAELTELVPPALRQRKSRAPRWQVEMTLEGTARLWRDGAPAGPLPAVGGAMRSAELLLPTGVALVRDLDLPRLSSADLHRLVALNIDRFTPFAAETVYFDTRVLERPAEGSTQRVRLGVLPRDRGKALLAQATALGVKVERMGVAGGADGLTLQFDFMRAIRAEEGGDPTRRRRTYLWVACAVLAAANLGAAVLRDSNDVNQLQQLVDAQQPAVAMATKLQRTIEVERRRRLELLARRSANEPLRILDAATRALPPGQWVQRLEWNGRAVRLVGFRKPGFDVLAALRGPALSAPRSLVADMSTKAANGLEPFDVMADATPRRTR